MEWHYDITGMIYFVKAGVAALVGVWLSLKAPTIPLVLWHVSAPTIAHLVPWLCVWPYNPPFSPLVLFLALQSPSDFPFCVFGLTVPQRVL